MSFLPVTKITNSSQYKQNNCLLKDPEVENSIL